MYSLEPGHMNVKQDTAPENLQNTVENFENWLVNERHISLEVARTAGINFSSNRIEIPIRLPGGVHHFSKYRRSPMHDFGPKYFYASGATADIFGREIISAIADLSTVIITEGELDALAMRTLGYLAVSSTGGAGTWKHEWRHLFADLTPVILYDADRAGIEGALRVASMLPNAKIAWLPIEFGKDPTEVIHAGHTEELEQCIREAYSYEVPSTDFSDTQRLSLLKILRDKLIAEKIYLNQSRDKTPFHRNFALEWTEEEITVLRDRISKPVRNPIRSDDRLVRAKEYPIKDLIKLNRDGFAACVYHSEKSASMRVYKDNHAFSYCCNRRSDAIDIYCVLNGLDVKRSDDFKQAVTFLSL